MKFLKQKNPLWFGLAILFIFLTAAESSFAQGQLNIYGYFSSRIEKYFSVPAYDTTSGDVEYKDENFELQFPYFNLILQQSISDKIKIYANLSAGGENKLRNVSLNNLWGEFIASNAFKFRVGKAYKKFGLYNEILDAVPTYYGVEPPQFLNPEHKWSYLFPNNTNLMIHGTFGTTNTLNYAISFDKFLTEDFEEAFPMGLDLNYSLDISTGHIKFGTAFYSTLGEAIPGEEEGGEEDDIYEGTGTFEWISSDNFSVYGGYLEAQFGDFLLQGEFWTTSHQSERDPDEVYEHLSGIDDTRNVSRFLETYIPNTPVNSQDLSAGNITTDVDYTALTWYVKMGYSFYPSIGEIGIYAQWDYYKNPEMIALPVMDNEHYGSPDQGEYNLLTFGLLYRPIPSSAIKFDVANHMYTFLGEDVFYPEFRLDFSFLFGQLL